MSGFSGIMSKIFAPTPAVASATPGTGPIPGQPGNLPGVGAEGLVTPGTAPNGVIPAGAVDLEKPGNSPLDQYKTLWDAMPTDPTKPNSKVSTELDPTKLQEIISKANFVNNVSQEDLAAISAGGEAAISAYTKSMNAVAQQVMLQATLASSKMLDTKIAEALASQEASIPELIRKQTASNELIGKNPTFNDPAIKPVIEAVQLQLATKFPKASAAELTQMSNDFITRMATVFAPAAAPNTSKSGQQDTDWDKFLTS